MTIIDTTNKNIKMEIQTDSMDPEKTYQIIHFLNLERFKMVGDFLMLIVHLLTITQKHKVKITLNLIQTRKVIGIRIRKNNILHQMEFTKITIKINIERREIVIF